MRRHITTIIEGAKLTNAIVFPQVQGLLPSLPPDVTEEPTPFKFLHFHGFILSRPIAGACWNEGLDLDQVLEPLNRQVEIFFLLVDSDELSSV